MKCQAVLNAGNAYVCRMNDTEMIASQQLINSAYASFNARDIDATLKMMAEDVKWPKAWEGDYAHGHDEVRAYWTRQWTEINPHVNPVGFRERDNGTLEVKVDQLVKDLDGNVVFDGKVIHVHTIRHGLIGQMDIEAAK